jgi:hypothetical protein
MINTVAFELATLAIKLRMASAAELAPMKEWAIDFEDIFRC